MLFPRPLWGSELDSKARQGTGRRSESQLSLQFFSGGRGRTHTHTHRRQEAVRELGGRSEKPCCCTELAGAGESEVTSRDSKGSKVNMCSAAHQEGPRKLPKSLQGHRTSRQTPDNQAETIGESLPNRCTSTFLRLCKPVTPVLKQLRT